MGVRLEIQLMMISRRGNALTRMEIEMCLGAFSFQYSQQKFNRDAQVYSPLRHRDTRPIDHNILLREPIDSIPIHHRYTIVNHIPFSPRRPSIRRNLKFSRNDPPTLSSTAPQVPVYIGKLWSCISGRKRRRTPTNSGCPLQGNERLLVPKL